MSKRFLPFVTQSVLVALFVCTGIVHAQKAQPAGSSANAARDLIIAVTTEVMNMVKNDPSIAKDTGRLTQIVDQKILPYTDMQRATRLTMGRHWREATPQQQQQLTAQFKDLLFYTYAGALSKVSMAQLRNQPPIDYKPLRAPPANTDVVVETVVMNEGKPVNIDYRLGKTPEGWKVYDVNIAGVWMIQTYREQFDEQIAQKGVEGLLKFLSERNQQLKAGQRA